MRVMDTSAPLTGIIGAMQAAEALKIISGAGQVAIGRLMLLDGLTTGMAQREIRVRIRSAPSAVASGSDAKRCAWN